MPDLDAPEFDPAEFHEPVTRADFELLRDALVRQERILLKLTEVIELLDERVAAFEVAQSKEVEEVASSSESAQAHIEWMLRQQLTGDEAQKLLAQQSAIARQQASYNQQNALQQAAYQQNALLQQAPLLTKQQQPLTAMACTMVGQMYHISAPNNMGRPMDEPEEPETDESVKASPKFRIDSNGKFIENDEDGGEKTHFYA